MGQYANQPDFITHSIKEVTPVAVESLTAADSLDSSVIYIGSNTGAQDIEVIPAGTVGPSVVTGFSSPGFVGSNGSGYTTGEEGTGVPVNSNSQGEGLLVSITADENGAITSLEIVTGESTGVGYSNGELINIRVDANKTATFIVLTEVGLPTQDQAVLFKNPPQGEWFPVTVDYVLSGNTTVTDLIAGK